MATQANPFAAPFKTLGVDLTGTDASAKHIVGQTIQDQSGNTYQYAFADTEAITANALVQVDQAGVVTLSDGAGDRIDGIAPTAIALDRYGWIGIKGDFGSVPATTGLVVDDLIQHYATASRVVIVLDVDEGGVTAHGAGIHTARGIVLVNEATNVATVRFF
jgi:hypothetical protein